MDNFRQRVLLVVTLVSVLIGVFVYPSKSVNQKKKVDTEVSYVEHTTQKKSSNLTTIVKNGLVKVDGVWGFYVDDVLQTSYNGLQSNENGTYVVENGIVNLDVTGLKKYNDVWYYIKNGRIDEKAYGLAKNKNGVYLVEDGKVNFSITGLKRVKGEWYYFKKGKLQTQYTGIKSNKNGTWLVEDGEIDFEYKGTYVASGSISNPKKGQKRYYVNKNKINEKRSTIVTKALAYLNTPYVYGGTNLSKGIDCSAFTRAIYAKAGISLERTSRDQATQGKNVSLSKAKPGDLIFYSSGKYSSISHVAIYIGNGKIVHAGYSKRKVVVANVNLGMNIKCIKSYIN